MKKMFSIQFKILLESISFPKLSQHFCPRLWLNVWPSWAENKNIETNLLAYEAK